MGGPENWEEYPVQYVKGVGPGRSRLLSRLGISTVRDLLYHFPGRYEDRSRIVPIKDARPLDVCTVRGTVQARGLNRTYRGYTILKAAVTDGSGLIYATWFNQPYLEKLFPVGADVVLSGKVESYGELQIVNPAFEVLGKDGDLLEAGCIVPVYPLTKGVYQKQMRRILREALNRFASSIKEFLPAPVLEKHGFMGLPEALEKIHFPETEEDYLDARRRLIFDEFFVIQLMLARGKLARKGGNGIAHKSGGGLVKRFSEALPFEMTGAQEKVIREIASDMASGSPMHRLVQGEVGSGKTVVAISAMLTAVESGCQAVLMAPTEILAEQHYLALQRLLAPLGLRTVLLTGGLGKRMRREVLNDIENGYAEIVIGTHALLEEEVAFKNPGLIVIDEQHKFGVKQREMLKRKGCEKSDLLMMSATPIPRTLALTVYGDIDISTIGELPFTRDVSTYLVSEDERPFMYGFIREEVGRGRQAYFIYPLVSESGSLNLKSASEMAARMKKDVFPDFRVGLLHGGMRSGEKEKTMRSFAAGEIDILVCTSVVEVGIDVPNASVMIIEHAERFGLSQLHQMRGRVGRGKHPSYCILVSGSSGGEARKRLEVLTETSDGFRIAREDLGLRGPGEFLGTRQHGLPELKLGNICSDMELLEAAREEGFRIAADDPGLANAENRGLRRVIGRIRHHNA